MSYYLELDRYRISLHILRCFMHLSIPFMVLPSVVWPFSSNSIHAMGYDSYVFLIHVGVMESFFIMNGFFAIQLLRKKTISQFILNRLRRIFIPFLAGMVLLIPFISLLSQCSKHQVPLSFNAFQLVIDQYRVNPYNFGHLWSLWYLLIIYVIFLLLEWRTNYLSSQLKKWSLGQIMSIVVVLASLVFLGYDRKYTLLPLHSLAEWPMLAYYFFFFCLGIWFYEHRDSIQNLKVSKLFYLIAILAVIVNVIYQKSVNPTWMIHLVGKFAYTLQALSFAIILYMVSKSIQIGSDDSIKDISHNMYWLYWIEVPVAILIHYLWVNTTVPLFLVLGGGVFTIFFSILSYRILFRNKKLGKISGFAS